MFVFLTDCVSCDDGDAVNQMVEDSNPITLKHFLKEIGGYEQIQNMPPFDFYEPPCGRKGGLKLKDDWHVSCGHSKFKGENCVYIQHSSIEYIWVEQED